MSNLFFRNTKGLMLFLGTQLSLFAQEQPDTQLRISPSVSYDFSKKFGMTLDYRLGYKENISQFQSSVFQLSTTYDWTKKIEIEVGYRFSTSFNKDYHRFIISLKYKYKWHRISIENTLKYQFQTERFDSEFMQFYKTPKQTFREKITVEYNVPKSKTTLFLAPELFLRMDKNSLKFNRMRYSIGGDYQLKYGNKVGVSFFYDDYTIPSKTDRLVFVTKYNLALNDLAKKIKKVRKKKQAARKIYLD